MYKRRGKEFLLRFFMGNYMVIVFSASYGYNREKYQTVGRK